MRLGAANMDHFPRGLPFSGSKSVTRRQNDQNSAQKVTLIEDFVRLGHYMNHSSRAHAPRALKLRGSPERIIPLTRFHSFGLKVSHGPKITTNVLKKYILLMESARIRHDMGFWAAAPPRAGMENRTAAPGTACVTGK